MGRVYAGALGLSIIKTSAESQSGIRSEGNFELGARNSVISGACFTNVSLGAGRREPVRGTCCLLNVDQDHCRVGHSSGSGHRIHIISSFTCTGHVCSAWFGGPLNFWATCRHAQCYRMICVWSETQLAVPTTCLTKSEMLIGL